MYSKTALTWSGWPSSTVSSVTCGWPTGLMPSPWTPVLKRCGKQAVDDFFANLGGIAAADDRLRHFAGTEAGNLGVFLIVANGLVEGLRDFVSRNVQHQFAGAFRIKTGPWAWS